LARGLRPDHKEMGLSGLGGVKERLGGMEGKGTWGGGAEQTSSRKRGHVRFVDLWSLRMEKAQKKRGKGKRQRGETGVKKRWDWQRLSTSKQNGKWERGYGRGCGKDKRGTWRKKGVGD